MKGQRLTITDPAAPVTADTLLDKWKCTCDIDNVSGHAPHHPKCDLEQCWFYVAGDATWNGTDLVYDDDDDKRQAMQEFDRTLHGENASFYEIDSYGRILEKDEDDLDLDLSWGATWAADPKDGKAAPAAFAPKDRHYQTPFVLPNGTTVFASSQHHDRQGDPIPDLGVYMDGCWTPDTRAYYIGCPDYGVPIPSPAVVLQIAREALCVAMLGGRVEFGCIGGHGRTGLILAVMCLITDDLMTGPEAVKFVRSTYCTRAIESAEQEWYIAGIRAELRAEAWPPKPAKPVYTFPKAAVAATATSATPATPSAATTAQPLFHFPSTTK